MLQVKASLSCCGDRIRKQKIKEKGQAGGCEREPWYWKIKSGAIVSSLSIFGRSKVKCPSKRNHRKTIKIFANFGPLNALALSLYFGVPNYC